MSRRMLIVPWDGKLEEAPIEMLSIVTSLLTLGGVDYAITYKARPIGIRQTTLIGNTEGDALTSGECAHPTYYLQLQYHASQNFQL